MDRRRRLGRIDVRSRLRRLEPGRSIGGVDHRGGPRYGDRRRPPRPRGTVVDRIDLTEAAGSGERDEYGHGTHVAGVLAGTGEASDGQHVGVAPGVDLVDVRVLRAEGDGDADRIASGIEYAVDDADADVVLLSLDFGGTDEERIAESIAWAVDSGAVVVASAGNDGEPRTIGTPGTEPEAKRLDVRVVDERNESVPNATVRVGHRENTST
ncbi:hypothetical protein D8S78_18875 [Natrialba swarupiae]|nr:hypothetical protein [Natrialba swarupiae]